MSHNRNGNDRQHSNSNSYWGMAAAVGGTAALVGGLAYWLTKPQEVSQVSVRTSDSLGQSTGASSNSRRVSERDCPTEDRAGQGSISDYLSSLLQRVSTSPSAGLPVRSSGRRGVSSTMLRANPVITNINGLFDDIYVRYIALKDDEFEQHYNVFNEIFFNHLHKSMKDVDSYYRKYSSMIQIAGSHYDRLRIKKPDEFDVDIVISLPLNIRENSTNPCESDIVIEPKSAGFLQLRMGKQFQRLHMRDGVEWLNNKAAFEWKDDHDYMLRSKFINWFKGVVDRALNKHGQTYSTPAKFCINGQTYTVEKSESGPAVTLFIKNNASGFKLDVDLVPALKFPEERWPITSTYRKIPENCSGKRKGTDYWMVVPKPNKAGQNIHDENRSWRIALHNQERELMHDTKNLRQAIRFMKKLRDAQGMDKIASYYVKTLFFWEIVERDDPNYWSSNSPATIFKMMVGKFHDALQAKKIPYFWNKDNNLIAHVDTVVLMNYAKKLKAVKEVLDVPSEYKKIAKYLLTPEEFMGYNMRFLHI